MLAFSACAGISNNPNTSIARLRKTDAMMPDAGITITPASRAQCTAFDAVSCHAGIGDAAGEKLRTSRRPRPTMPIMATAMIR
jgi:hypothetical protein